MFPYNKEHARRVKEWNERITKFPHKIELDENDIRTRAYYIWEKDKRLTDKEAWALAEGELIREIYRSEKTL